MLATPEEVLRMAQEVHAQHRYVPSSGEPHCRYCLADLEAVPVQHKPDCVELVAERVIEGRLL